VNNDDNNKIWDSLACDIVDGEAENSKTAGHDPRVIQNLQRLNQLAAAFLPPEPNQADANQSSQPVLFYWGHLAVQKKLGEGAQGMVYLAHDPMLDRPVALKIIKQKHLAPYQSRAFIEEARRMAKVRNRHVLAIHGANTHDQQVGFWADWIDGEELQPELLTTESDLLKLMGSLSDALMAVHEAGLIHGDIKPANVMQAKDGRIILMDFGAGSELVISEQPLSGTPRYMAPELFQGQGISQATDVYALGTLLYYLVSHQFPFPAQNLADIEKAHANQGLQPLKPNSKCSKRTCRLINSMLNTDPAIRPTAKDIAEQVNWIKTSPQRRQKKWAIGLLFFILVAGVFFTSLGFYRANKAQQATQQAKQQTDAINSFFRSMLASASALGTGREVRVTDLLLKAQEEVNEKFKDSPLVKADITSTIGRTLMDLNMLQEAEAQFEQAIQIKEQLFPANHADLLNSRLSLAMIYNKQGRYEDGADICHAVLALPGIDSMIKNQATIRLAESHIFRGNHQQAEALLLPLLPTIEPPATATSNNSILLLSALTKNATMMSKFAEAEKYARQGINWLRKYPRDQERNHKILTNTLTSNLLQQGKATEALQILEPLLADIATNQGKETFIYLNTLVNYAAALRDSGDAEKALVVEEEALALSKNIEGDQVNMTVVLGTNIANSKVALGLYEEAEQLMRDTWQLANSKLGPDKMNTLLLEYNLAELLNNQFRAAEAHDWARKTIEKASAALGEKHLITLLSKDNLAVSLRLMGNIDGALTIHQTVLADLEQVIPPTSPPALVAQSHYIDSLVAAEHNDVALTLLKNRLSVLLQKHPEDHPDVKSTQQQIISLESDQ